jgi:ATP-binding cassette, subfamily B, bacterial
MSDDWAQSVTSTAPTDAPSIISRSAGLGQLRRVLPFVKPHVGKLSLVFGLTVASSLLGLAYPLATKFLIDDILLGTKSHLLIPAAVVLAAWSVLNFASGALTRYLYTSVSARILMEMRVFLFRHLQSLSPRFYARTRTGEIVSRLNSDVAEIQAVATDSLFSLALSLLTLVGTVGVLLYLNWKLFLLCFVLVPFSIRLLVPYRQKIAAQARVVRERNADLSSTLLESLHGMKWIKTVGAEEAEATKLTDRNKDYISSLLRYQVVSAFAHGLPATFLGLSTLVLLLYGGHQVIAGGMTLGALAAFAVYQGRVLSPMQNVIGLYLSLQRARVSLDRVFEFLDLEPEVREHPRAMALDTSSVRLEFRDVTFAYQKDTPVVRDVSFTLNPGSRLAIVGPSGAGKSTLVDLLLRFYDPVSGSVQLEGYDLRDLQLQSLRRQVAVVSSEPFLFHASIEENLRYANWDATSDQLWDAVRKADLEEFVLSLPQGLATMVGERGLRLSTGQRQRIAIARAVLRDARLWIFDEATATLDVLTESRIWQSLEDCLSGRSALIITHRLSSVRNADQIVVLHQGEVVQRGTHDDLAEVEGLYRELQRAAQGPEISRVAQVVAT